MARKVKAYQLWRQMKPASLRQLAFAVFLVFAVMGPLSILMESELHLVTWPFVLVQTISTGGMAASIILFGRRRWWAIVLIVGFWLGIMALNAGGVSWVVDPNGLRVKLGNPKDKAGGREAVHEVTLEPAELRAIYTQRGLIGTLAIGLVAAGYVMFLRVIGKELEQRVRLETEVTIARDIQRSLLPDSVTRLPWCTAAGLTIPATEVGGDYFDLVKLSDESLAVVIADVTGHGAGAGILSAMTKSAFHLQLRHDPSPEKVLECLNRTLYDLSDEKTFVTFAYVLLDPAVRRARIATAGHPPVLYYQSSSKSIVPLRTASPALGMKEGSRYSSLETAWGPADSFVLFTDGIVEAEDGKGMEFGIERLGEAMAITTRDAEQRCGRVVESLRDFTGSREFKDDVSIVCVQCT